MSKKETHDRKVKKIASILRRRGYKVQASVGAYSRPERVGRGYIPDIVAKNNKTAKIKIVEVKLGKDLRKAKDQILTFSRKAKRSKMTDFELVITNPKKLIKS